MQLSSVMKSVFVLVAFVLNHNLFAQKETDKHKQSNTPVENQQTSNKHLETDSDLVIATSIKPLTKALPECTLGNLITDAFLWYGQQKNKEVCAAIVPFSSIKSDYVSPGEITVGIIKNILPQKTKLAVAEIPGKFLDELCQKIAQKGGGCVAGISFEIIDKQAVNIRINGEMLNGHLYYTVTLPEFMLKNKDYYSFLNSCVYKQLNVSLCDAVIAYLEYSTYNGKVIDAELQGRILFYQRK